MARYLPLFAIQIEHAFFNAANGDAGSGLRLLLTPSKQTAVLMQQENLLMRQNNSGIEVWRETNAQAESAIDELTATPLVLVFLVQSSDAHLDFYTEWPVARPLCFKNIGSAEQSKDIALQAETSEEQDFGMSSFERQRNPTLFSVQIQHTIKHQENAAMTIYRIPLAAKALHWKYYFSGALSKKALEIVDLDTNHPEATRFTASTNGVGKHSLAFISEHRLTMRSTPAQRFQLREKGANGRVLMRRLPNASIHKIGKERTPDGQTLIVAEIYIHQ